jgi:hypothetical protein
MDDVGVPVQHAVRSAVCAMSGKRSIQEGITVQDTNRRYLLCKTTTVLPGRISLFQ